MSAIRASRLVEPGATCNIKRVGDIDLNLIDVVAIQLDGPFANRKASSRGLFAEEVVDAEDLLLGEGRMERGVVTRAA